MAQPEFSEQRVVAVIGAVQFIAIVDFMMILPLGPDLTIPLGIDAASLGLVVAAYTVAAAVAGIAGALFFDRVGRRQALVVGLVGLGLSTLAAVFARDLTTMMCARAAAGLFGGPVTALGLTVVTDAIPVERRGRAIGAVMGANAVGAIAGVPLGLWLADLWGWPAPFLCVGAGGLAVAAVTLVGLPSLSAPTCAAGQGLASLWALAWKPTARVALAMVFAVMVASFLLTPNLSAFVQYNLGFPREQIPLLYFVAGAVSFVSMRIVGRIVDRFGAFPVGAFAAVGFVAVVVAYVMVPDPVVPVGIGFVVLLVSLSSRNVAVRTLTTQVPAPAERARYLSLQSSVRYLAAATGAVCSSALLTSNDDGVLAGMVPLGALVCVLSVGVLPMLWLVERAVRRQRLEGS